jgi:4-hydroxy-tetrahydrodipicolinate reductase
VLTFGEAQHKIADMADPIKVVVSGAAGRMGGTACEAVEGANGMELIGRADPALDTPATDVLAGADVMVDFTTPEAAPGNVQQAVAAGVHAVVGTTGFDLDDLRATIEAADGDAKVFVAPNFAIGAVLMMEASKLAAKHMPEVEIIELHHDQKKDAPSGTAKRTAELIREAGGNVHEPIHSVRLPGLVAHQEVTFGGEGQTLTIRHDSIDRHSFMPGVLLAVRKVADLPERFVVGLENLL